jgi:hypothetical protein
MRQDDPISTTLRTLRHEGLRDEVLARMPRADLIKLCESVQRASTEARHEHKREKRRRKKLRQKERLRLLGLLCRKCNDRKPNVLGYCMGCSREAAVD